MASRAVAHPIFDDTEEILPHVLSFCYERTLSLVSRAFRDANSLLITEERHGLLARAPGGEAHMSLASDRFRNAGESLKGARQRQRGEFLIYLRDEDRLGEHFSQKERTEFRLYIEQSPSEAGADSNIATSRRCLIFYGELNEAFRNLHQAPEGEVEQRRSALKEMFKNFAYEQSLRARAERVFQGHLNVPYTLSAACSSGLQLAEEDRLLHHVKNAACLKGLYWSQVARLCQYGNRFFTEFEKADKAHADSFKLTRFQQAERLCVDLKVAENYNLEKFWSQLEEDYPDVFPVFMVYNRMQRAWLNNPANAAQLEQIDFLSLSDLSILPPEIGRFKNLTTLHIHEGEAESLQSLPNELATINLESLVISNADFETIPYVLGRMSATVEFFGNKRRAVLPEFVALQHCGGIATHILEFFWGIIERPEYIARTGEDRGSPVFMGLKREELSEIPFFLWFRDTFSLPYFYQLGIPYFVATHGIETQMREWDLPECISIPLIAFTITPLSILYGLCVYLFDVPVFLFNLLLDYTIQPLVTYCRSLLGYSPMVRL
ncbi:MAG: hypothetical protein HYX48_03705 [Chlamydiales bacterium]|nr:hypothetical protein [Chlamydiales bacterium]